MEPVSKSEIEQYYDLFILVCRNREKVTADQWKLFDRLEHWRDEQVKKYSTECMKKHRCKLHKFLRTKVDGLVTCHHEYCVKVHHEAYPDKHHNFRVNSQELMTDEELQE